MKWAGKILANLEKISIYKRPETSKILAEHDLLSKVVFSGCCGKIVGSLRLIRQKCFLLKSDMPHKKLLVPENSNFICEIYVK